MKHLKLFEAFNQEPDIWSPELVELWRLGLIEPEPWEKKVLDYMERASARDLHINRTPIKSLPPDLRVGGTLWISDTLIESLPTGLKVGGSLLADGSQIKNLPPDLKVGGRLDARRTPLKSLPPGLKVEGNLVLWDTPLASSGVTEPELRAQIEAEGGWVKGSIVL